MSYYEKVKDFISREDFEETIKKLDEEFGNLLDRDVLELIIVDEIGRNRKSVIPISDIKPNMECTVYGIVAERIENKNHVSLIISDNTLSCILNLWGRNAEIGKYLKIGDVIKVINAYSRLGREGVEINAGRWSCIEINPKDAPTIEIEPVEGIIVKKENTDVMFDENGNIRFFKRIWLKSNGKILGLRVWDEHVKTVNGLKEGRFVEVKNPVRRLLNGKIEIEVRSISEILTKS